MAEHLYTYQNPTSEKDIKRICQLLEHDGIVAYPTDLNWAFACDARNPKAMDRIRMLKPQKSREQPFSLLCKDISMAAGLTNIDNFAYPFLKKALPGPYTILLERHRSLPRQLKDKRKTVGIRIPNSPFVLSLLETYDHPLATTSIPLRDDASPYHFGYEVMESYGHALDMVIDLGDELSGAETTVIDLSGGEVIVVREGAGDPAIFTG